PWMPRAMVSSIGAFHVPVSRGRLLRRRLPRSGSSSSRLIRVRLQGAERQADDSCRPDAYPRHRLGAEREMHDMHRLKAIYNWLEFRLKLEGAIKETVTHHV